MTKSIMVIGAHADDVELHSGGTLFKYMDRGYQVVYVMATNNMSGCKRTVQPDGTLTSQSFDVLTTIEYRKREAAEAARLFNTEPIHLDHPQRHCQVQGPDGSLQTLEVRYGCPLPPGVPENVPSILTASGDSRAVGSLAELMSAKNPEVVITHGFGETNPEHYTTFLLSVKAYWQAVAQGYQGSLLGGVRDFTDLGRMACCWETWVDITDYVDRRMAAVQKHVSQYPPDFAYGGVYWREKAEARGAACGVTAAEVFNFVNTDVNGADGSELLTELVRNRAGKQPWGL